MWIKPVSVGIGILPQEVSAAALGPDGAVMGTADLARGKDLAADVDALLAALGKKVPSIARGKFRAAVGWGGASVLAVCDLNGKTNKKEMERTSREALEREAGRSLDGWRIAWTPVNGARTDTILAGAVPEAEILGVDAAVAAARGEAVGANLLPLILAQAVRAEDRKQEASVLVVLAVDSVSIFLIDGKGAIASCRHRMQGGDDALDLAETEVMRGLVAWEGSEGPVPSQINLIEAAEPGRLAERLAEKAAIPIREVSVDEILRRKMKGGKAPDSLSEASRLALLAALRGLRGETEWL